MATRHLSMTEGQFSPYQPGNGAGIGSGFILSRQLSNSRSGGGRYYPTSSPNPKPGQYRSVYPLEDTSPAWRDSYDNKEDKEEDEDEEGEEEGEGGSRTMVDNAIANPGPSAPLPPAAQYPRRNTSNPWGGVGEGQRLGGHHHKRTNTLPSMRIQEQYGQLPPPQPPRTNTVTDKPPRLPPLAPVESPPRINLTLPSPSWIGQSQWHNTSRDQSFRSDQDHDHDEDQEQENQPRRRSTSHSVSRSHHDRSSEQRHSRHSQSHQSPPIPPKDVGYIVQPQHEKQATVSSGGNTRKETHNLALGYDQNGLMPQHHHQLHQHQSQSQSQHPTPMASTESWSMVPQAHEIGAGSHSALALHHRHFEAIQGMQDAYDKARSLPDHGGQSGHVGATMQGEGNDKSPSRFEAMKSFRAGFPFRRHTTKTRAGPPVADDNDNDNENENDNDNADEQEQEQDHAEHPVDDENKLQRTLSRGQRFTSRAREIREWMRAVLSGNDAFNRAARSGGAGGGEGGVGGEGEGEEKDKLSRSKSKGKEKAHGLFDDISPPFTRGPANRIRLASKHEATSPAQSGKPRLGDIFNRHQNQNHHEIFQIEPPSPHQLLNSQQGYQQTEGVEEEEERRPVLTVSSPQPLPPTSFSPHPPSPLSDRPRRNRRERSPPHTDEESQSTERESELVRRSRSPHSGPPPIVPAVTSGAVASRAKSPQFQQQPPHTTFDSARVTESPLPLPPPTPPSSNSDNDGTTERGSDEVAQPPQPTYEIINRRIVETGKDRTVEIATWRERVADEVESSSVGDGNELRDGDHDEEEEGEDEHTERVHGGTTTTMKEHMSVYFVTSDEYALALAEESKLGAALGNAARRGGGVEHPGLHSRVEYVDYKMLEEARDRTMDITQVGLGSIKPGPMVGSMSYRNHRDRDRNDMRPGREVVKKIATSPRLPSLPRTSGANSLNTSRRGRDKEEKERERSFARITAPLSDKGKGKERAFIKPPSTNSTSETTTDESSDAAPPPVKLSPPPRPLSPSNKSSASEHPPPLQINTGPYTNGHATTRTGPLSPRLYIPDRPFHNPSSSTHISRQKSQSRSQAPSQSYSQAPSQSQSRRQHQPYTSTPIEPKAGSTAPFRLSDGSTISTITSNEKVVANSNSFGSIMTGTTTPPHDQAGGSPPPLPPTHAAAHPHHHHRKSPPTQHAGAPPPPPIISRPNTGSPLTPLLLLPTPPLTHLLPALNSLGITTPAHLKAIAQMSAKTRDREVRPEAQRLGISVVEWAMVVDLAGNCP